MRTLREKIGFMQSLARRLFLIKLHEMKKDQMLNFAAFKDMN